MALDIAQKAERKTSIADISRSFGALAQSLGDLEAADRWYRESLSHYEQLDDRANITVTLMLVGSVARQRGDIEQAAQYARRGLTLAEPGRDDELIELFDLMTLPRSTTD